MPSGGATRWSTKDHVGRVTEFRGTSSVDDCLPSPGLDVRILQGLTRRQETRVAPHQNPYHPKLFQNVKHIVGTEREFAFVAGPPTWLSRSRKLFTLRLRLRAGEPLRLMHSNPPATLSVWIHRRYQGSFHRPREIETLLLILPYRPGLGQIFGSFCSVRMTDSNIEAA